MPCWPYVTITYILENEQMEKNLNHSAVECVMITITSPHFYGHWKQRVILNHVIIDTNQPKTVTYDKYSNAKYECWNGSIVSCWRLLVITPSNRKTRTERKGSSTQSLANLSSIHLYVDVKLTVACCTLKIDFNCALATSRLDPRAFSSS